MFHHGDRRLTMAREGVNLTKFEDECHAFRCIAHDLAQESDDSQDTDGCSFWSLLAIASPGRRCETQKVTKIKLGPWVDQGIMDYNRLS